MNEENPPPIKKYRIKKYSEFNTIEDLRDSVIDDIKYFENQRMPDDGDYMSHMITFMIDSKINYLKEKFEIDDDYRSQ